MRFLGALALVGLVGCGGARERNEIRSTTDAGGTTDGGTNQNLRSYGSGDRAILLSGTPPQSCWYIEETVRICGGSPPTRDTHYNNICYDNETNCLARQPEDSETETSMCWTRISYENPVNGDPIYATCDQVDAYFDQDGQVQCLYHRHCPTGRQCQDYRCVCPPGAQCGCFACGPAGPARCEGETLVYDRPLDECDAQDRCQYQEVRVDCGAQGGTCNAAQQACEGGAVDAGVTDARPADASPADSGPCQCPPQLPPRCEGNVAVSDHCDSVTCRPSTERDNCEARGEICDPNLGQCVEDPAECRQDSDCPPAGPTPPGMCREARCVDLMCIEVAVPC